MPSVKDDPQGRFSETVLDDPGLEQLLEEREAEKPAAKAFRDLDKRAKERLAEMAPEGPVRVGRFRIEPTVRAGGGFEIPEWERPGYTIRAG